MKAVLPGLLRPALEPHLPADLDVAWWQTEDDAMSMIADAEIAWLDLHPSRIAAGVMARCGPEIKWVTTVYSGLDALPLPHLRERGAILTNGVGINAISVAEYAVMGVLMAAKRFDEVVRARDRHEWQAEPPGKIVLFETKAVIIGLGAIGRIIGERLSAFGVQVTGVTQSGRDGALRPDQWRARLAEFDWVILAAPSNAHTKALIGSPELAAMKSSAWLINIARGDLIDDAALVAALECGRIGGAFLDPTNPEPLPPDHRLWAAPNCMISMHLSGRSQSTAKAVQRAAALFLRNLVAYREGRRMENVVDLAAGH